MTGGPKKTEYLLVAGKFSVKGEMDKKGQPLVKRPGDTVELTTQQAEKFSDLIAPKGTVWPLGAKVAPTSTPTPVEDNGGAEDDDDDDNEIDVTDKAEELANENGIDLSTVEGTGAGGRIVVDDVQSTIDALAEAADASGDSDEGDED